MPNEPPLTVRDVRMDEVDAISNFIVGCIRTHFNKHQLGPYEYFSTDAFRQDYQRYRHAAISNPQIIKRIITCSTNEESVEEIVAYVEFGPPKAYFDSLNIKWEILCLFSKTSAIGSGLGTTALAVALEEAIASMGLVLGRDTIGVQTVQGNPSIEYYRHLGAEHKVDMPFSVSPYRLKKF